MRKWRWDLKWTSSGGYYLRLRIKNVPGMPGTQGVGDESSNYVEGSQKESPSLWTARSGWVIVSLGEQPKLQRAFIICRQWKKSPETLHTLHNAPNTHSLAISSRFITTINMIPLKYTYPDITTPLISTFTHPSAYLTFSHRYLKKHFTLHMSKNKLLVFTIIPQYQLSLPQSSTSQ